MKNLKAFKHTPMWITAVFLLLNPCSTSFADCHKKPKHDHFSGLFIGISGGGIHSSAKYFRYRQGGVFGNISTQDSITDSSGVIGGQFQISQTYAENFNVGMEVWANRSFVNLQTKDNVFFKESLSYKIKQSFGIAGRLGIMHSSTLFYIKPGIIFSKREVSSQFLAITTDTGLPIPSYRNKKYMHGFYLGLGSEVSIPNSRFTIGGEASATHYQKLNYTHPMPAGIPGDIKIRFRPKAFLFLIKVNYKLHSFN